MVIEMKRKEWMDGWMDDGDGLNRIEVRASFAKSGKSKPSPPRFRFISACPKNRDCEEYFKAMPSAQ